MPKGTDTAAGGNPAIPDGWQIAPIDPPRSMILRGAAVSLCPYSEVAAIYAAMMAAVPAAPIAEAAQPDRRLNLAIALFEAAYGMTLRAWSDQTRDFWLARADAFADAGKPIDAEAEIERLAQFLHDEGGFDDAMTGRTWPEHAGDTGQRGKGWVKIVPADVCAHFRDVARRWLKPRTAPKAGAA